MPCRALTISVPVIQHDDCYDVWHAPIWLDQVAFPRPLWLTWRSIYTYPLLSTVLV